MSDMKAAILAEAADMAMHHLSIDARAFACAVSDYLTTQAAAPEPDFDALLGTQVWFDRKDVKRILAALTSAPAVPEADALRAEGWAVAVHNDYKLQGVPYTFWLFTKDGRAIKGEGQSDAEALAEVRAALKGVQPGERGEEGDWYCEDHPEHLMGHDGCNGMGVIESARIPMLVRLLKIATQETREANQMRDDMVARVRASKQEVP